MARTDTLTNFLSDVSTSIKNKLGDNTPIQANQFDTKISSIPDVSDNFHLDLSQYTQNTTTTSPVRSASVGDRCFVYNLIPNFPKLSLDFTGYTHLHFIFMYDTSLESIDVSLWDVHTIESYRAAFFGCSSLTRFDCSMWTTTAATSITLFFKECTALKWADMSSFKGSLNIGELFDGCTSLEHMDIRGLDLSTCTNTNTFLGSNYRVPTTCEIIVGTQADKDFMSTSYSSYTNVKTVAEYEAE